MVSSVRCKIVSSLLAGKSSGEISVATMSRSVLRASPLNSFSATHCTRNFTSVLGMLQLGLYMLMWSALYVHQPRANSETSPVPITKPAFMRMLVRMRAWMFSKITS